MNELERQSEDFAIWTVKKLRSAGFQALWAGGCVRDRLVGRIPKDFDVATNAIPEEVCEVFGEKRTLKIGAAFGVVAVLGKKPLPPIEVATFRNEGGYADGRHPGHVSFSTAEEDAQRRDFTINGIFYDPIDDEVIDYVDGQSDLRDRVIRCIGKAPDRFAEDHLRMLRAIRFAAAFAFRIEPQTLSAIQSSARHITAISAERIAHEMRRMMSHPNAKNALELCQESNLRDYVLPEFQNADTEWEKGLDIVGHLKRHTFELTVAAMLREIFASQQSCIDRIAQRWKLANSEKELIQDILEHESILRNGDSVPWPKLQRVLIEPFAETALEFARVITSTLNADPAGVNFCQAKLKLPRRELDPPPLISGDDLIVVGIRPGPAFRTILESIRDDQLEGKITTKEEAIQAAIQIAQV